MSVFPPSLWKPSQKDLLADLNPSMLRIGEERVETNAQVGNEFGFMSVYPNTTQNRQDPRFALDKIAVITRACCFAQGGGAQTVTSIEWRFIEPSASARIATLGRQTFSANTATFDIDFGEGLLMAPTELLLCVGNFSAAAIANTLLTALHGYFVPRGNWQFP